MALTYLEGHAELSIYLKAARCLLCGHYVLQNQGTTDLSHGHVRAPRSPESINDESIIRAIDKRMSERKGKDG